MSIILKAISIIEPPKTYVAYKVTEENILSLAALFSASSEQFVLGTVSSVSYLDGKPYAVNISNGRMDQIEATASIGQWLLVDVKGRIYTADDHHISEEYEWANDEVPEYAASTYTTRTGSIDGEKLRVYMGTAPIAGPTDG